MHSSAEKHFEFGDLKVRPYADGDEVALLESFNRVFGGVDPNFVPRNVDWWRWRFLEIPSGSRVLLAWTEDGQVAGQFAGLCQRMRLDGEGARFMQGVDHFSDPRLRRSLRRNSLLSFLGNTQWGLSSGPPPTGDTVMWGLPVPAAWRVGKELVRYEVVRTQNKLSREIGGIDGGAAGGVEVEELRRIPEGIGRLFEKLSEGRGAIELRDREHLTWRYLDCPDRDYRLGLARRGGQAVGYAVYAQSGFDGEQNLALVADWLAPAQDSQVRGALLNWLLHCARQGEAERMTALFPDTQPEWLAFQEAGFRVAPTSYFVICRNAMRKYDPRWLYHNWYYTLGDTDLV